MNNDFLSFIKFLDNREEYEGRIKDLDKATDKQKAAEKKAVAAQSEADKRIEVLNTQIDAFAPDKKILLDLQDKLDDREAKINARDEKLKSERKEFTAIKKEIETKQTALERTEKHLEQKETRLNEINDDQNKRMDVIKEKEARLKNYFKE